MISFYRLHLRNCFPAPIPLEDRRMVDPLAQAFAAHLGIEEG
jgi:hypothetical protein